MEIKSVSDYCNGFREAGYFQSLARIPPDQKVIIVLLYVDFERWFYMKIR